jgi:hypothetical protein
MNTFSFIIITNKANLTKIMNKPIDRFSSLMRISCLICLTIISCQNDKKEQKDKLYSSKKDNLTAEIDTQKSEKQTPQISDIYAQIAVETCNCFGSMLEKADEADRFMKENHQNKVDEIEEAVEKLRPQAEICGAEIKNKYSDLTSARDQKKILEALNKYCPESATLLRKTLSMKISQ